MIAVLRSQIPEISSIEIDGAEVLVIRVFFLIESRCHKINFLLTCVYINDFAYNPFSTRHLILDFSGLPVHAIQMAPAVTFRHPKHFRTVIQIMPEIINIRDKRIRPFVCQMANLPVYGAYLADHITLMPALIKFKSECTTVFSPSGKIKVELIFIQLRIQCYLFLTLYIK